MTDCMDKGRQFLICLRGFPLLGRHVMTHCLSYTDSIPLSKLLFIALVTKYFKSFQKTSKNSDGKPSKSGVLLFWVFLSAVLNSSGVRCPSKDFA